MSAQLTEPGRTEAGAPAGAAHGIPGEGRALDVRQRRIGAEGGQAAASGLGAAERWVAPGVVDEAEAYGGVGARTR